ncbi:MAG: hypothetical protein KJ043_09115 [Anaerolineae bacterium]|nr:hypothetical protein [Anaerolineae bacterium]
MTKNILVSVPLDFNLTQHQQLLKKQFLDKLRQDGLTPHIFGELGMAKSLAWEFDNVRNFIRDCDGCVVLGFIRYEFSVDDNLYQFITEYNHFEGAIAIAYDVPLLVTHEDGASERGILYKPKGAHPNVIQTVPFPHFAAPTWFNADVPFNHDYANWLNQL